MTTKLISLFALCVLLGAVMLACGGAADNTNTATTNTNTNSNAKTTASPAASPAATAATTSSGGDIGVAACDEFLKKYETCVSGKVPAAAQATFKTSLDTWRSSWKKLAETPQGKAGLETACKSAMEQAKTSLSTYGCSW